MMNRSRGHRRLATIAVLVAVVVVVVSVVYGLATRSSVAANRYRPGDHVQRETDHCPGAWRLG